MSEELREGGCLCGQVRYKVPAQPVNTIVCHCKIVKSRPVQRFLWSLFSPEIVFN